MLTPIKGGGRGDASYIYSNWPVIPAHPGFELLTAIDDGGRVEVMRQRFFTRGGYDRVNCAYFVEC